MNHALFCGNLLLLIFCLQPPLSKSPRSQLSFSRTPPPSESAAQTVDQPEKTSTQQAGSWICCSLALALPLLLFLFLTPPPVSSSSPHPFSFSLLQLHFRFPGVKLRGSSWPQQEVTRSIVIQLHARTSCCIAEGGGLLMLFSQV